MPGRQRSLRRAALLLGTALAALAGPAAAGGPTGGAVVRGEASIGASAGRTTIRQKSNRAVIDWKGFDVGRDHRVTFDQPGRNSATLNRVRSAAPSVIEGAIEAPGTVIIQNGAGVIFTRDARIDTGGLVATSQNVDAERFLRDGGLTIGGGEAAGARVVNQGEITVGEAGLAALVGGDVENAGRIVARRGTVALASGARTTIDLAGDGVLRLAVEGDGSGGVVNAGSIEAEGGRIVLSAGAASRSLDAAINTTGALRAGSAGGDGGAVEIAARGDGRVRIAGAVDVRGGRKGGAVTATGAEIAVARGARIDARGGVDGGTVRLGGGARGEGPLPRANNLRMEAGASIAADGALGRGGEVVLWSEGLTSFDGAISAEGEAGGGFVETSGRYALEVGPNGAVRVGSGGSWLLDPRDINIGTGGLTPVPPGVTTPPAGGTVYNVNSLAIISTLNAGGDVTISTFQPASSMAGNITVSNAMSWTGAGDLTLDAEGSIAVNAAMTSTGAGGLRLEADLDVVANAALSFTGAGGVAAVAGRDVTINSNIRADAGGALLGAGRTVTINGVGGVPSGVEVSGAGALSMLARTGDVVVGGGVGNRRIVTAAGPLIMAAPQGSVRLNRTSQQPSNIQVFSTSGSVDLSAGDEILVQGGAVGGRWVRVGTVASSADVSLEAPTIRILGGGPGNTFAEVVSGPGGSIAMEAEEIVVQNGAGSEGRIFASGESSLSLLAERQTWNGPVRAGNGGAGNLGGDVTVSGAITAGISPGFLLAPNRDFLQLAAGPQGAPSSYVSPQSFVVETSGSGTIDLAGPLTASQILLESAERVGLGPASGLTATGPDDSLVVAAGRQFRNEAGPDALAAGGLLPGRWLLYIDAFAGLVGAEPATTEFDLYGRPYPTNPPGTLAAFGGDRIVYGEIPTLTFTGDVLSKTYGTALAFGPGLPGYTVSGLRPGDDLADALDGAPSVASAGAAANAPVAGSPYTLEVLAQASAQGYALNLVDGTITVTPAALTVAADDARRSYGAANPPFTASFSGFVNGENESVLGGSLAFATPATAASNVGDYAIAPSGLTSGNYAITYVDGTLTIDPAQLTLTVADQNRSYGSNAFDGRAFTATGFVLGQDASVITGALQTTATQTSNVGAYAITSDGLTATNYAFAPATGTLTIDPAQLTVAVADQNRTYGSAAFDPRAFTATGFVLGQDASVITGALATTATQTSNVGTYAITGDALAAQNYTLVADAGTLTIDPAQLVLTVAEQNRTYGSTTFNGRAFTATGFVLGQDASVITGALATTATQTSNVGTYAITSDALAAENYTFAPATGTLTIDPAQLTLTVADQNRTYGSNAFNGRGFTATGFVLGQDASVITGALQTTATQTSNVGAYAITSDGLTATNYAFAPAAGTLTIDPARLTLTVADQNRTYGSAAFDGRGFTATGFVLGQDASVITGALQTTATQTSNVGAYAITSDGLTATNYAFAPATGTLTIDPAQLALTVADQNRTYGSAAFDGRGFTATGFVLGQDASVIAGALTTDATQTSNAGSYDIASAGLSAANYVFAPATGRLTIDPAALRVIANDTSRPQSAANPRFTARYEGFVLGQDAAVLGGVLAFATPATPASPPGGYAIEPGGLTSGNYAIAFVPGTLTVTASGGGGGTTLPAIDANAPRFGIGVPPFTPGDAAFRTTRAESPQAIESTFALDYSLGEVAVLAPAGDPDAGGFTPAAGGGGGASACAGPALPGTTPEGCEQTTARESFWATIGGPLQ